jgi:hypothetical protein
MEATPIFVKTRFVRDFGWIVSKLGQIVALCSGLHTGVCSKIMCSALGVASLQVYCFLELCLHHKSDRCRQSLQLQSKGGVSSYCPVYEQEGVDWLFSVRLAV